MRKKVYGKRLNKKIMGKCFVISLLFFGLLFLSNPITGAEKIKSQSPTLEIEQITGGFGIETVITNVGDQPANNVRWNTNISGDFVF